MHRIGLAMCDLADMTLGLVEVDYWRRRHLSCDQSIAKGCRMKKIVMKQSIAMPQKKALQVPAKGYTIMGLALACLMTACAPMPALGPVADARPPESFASAQSFKAPEAAWPNERWWEKYADAQLNQLIEEGLKDAPDLKAAQARVASRRSAIAIDWLSALYPQLAGNANVFGQELSNNDNVPPAYNPQGWYSYGQATLNFNWEIDFWGKNRSALAAAVSEKPGTSRRSGTGTFDSDDVDRARLCRTDASTG